LPIFAFIQNDLQLGMLLARAQKGSALRFESSHIRDLDALLQRFNKLLIRHNRDLHVIGFIKVGLRVSDSCSPFRIIGQKQQTLTGLVEPSDWSDPR
jgi:hypothetical protein